MKKEKAPTPDAIDKIVKDPLIRTVMLRRKLVAYEELLRGCRVPEEDVKRNTAKLAHRVNAPELSQGNARHLLVLLNQFLPDSKTS